MSNISIVPH